MGAGQKGKTIRDDAKDCTGEVVKSFASEKMKATESPYREIEVIPTGYANLDKILGLGGIPLRKITEISGQNSVGKSTLALTIVAEAQKLQIPCLWVDVEFSFEEMYATSLGVDCTQLDLIQEEFAESALDQTEEWIRENSKGLVIIDAIGGLSSRAEAEKSAEGRTIGGQAKLVAVFCRKIVPQLAINNIGLIALNHEFTDLMTGRLMTSGGAKLGYHKSIWIRLKKGKNKLMRGEQQVGNMVEAQIWKNKLAATMMQECTLQMEYGKGFSKQADLMEEAIDRGVLEKRGQFYYLQGERVARGDNGLREKFKDNFFAEKIKELLTN